MARLLNRNTQYVMRMTYCVFLLLAACTPAATPTYFIPPTAPPRIQISQPTTVAFATSTPTLVDAETTPTTEPASNPELPSPTATCTNSLSFVEDITVPDGTLVTAGQSFVKQWRVENSGTCDWDSVYQLKRISGDAMGLPETVALYPARAGTQAVVEMTLTAPTEPGPYRTIWQAMAPDGTPFEQAIYVDIVVQ